METRDKLQALTVVLGLLTFLVVAHDRNFWLASFKYETDGLKCEQDRCMIHVVIRNGGGTVEEGVEFELPSALNKNTRIYVDRWHEIVKRGDSTVLQLGPLHPGTKRHVAIFTPPGSSLAPVQAQRLNIWSKVRTASYDGSSEDEPQWMRVLDWVAWIGGAFFVMLFGVGIYINFFAPLETRRKLLQEQVDDHLKQLAALDELIAKRQTVSK